MVRKEIIFFLIIFGLNLFSKSEEIFLPDIIVEDRDLSRFGKLEEMEIFKKKFSKDYFLEKKDNIFSLVPLEEIKKGRFLFSEILSGNLKNYDFGIGYGKREKDFYGGYIRRKKELEIFDYQKAIENSGSLFYNKDKNFVSFFVLNSLNRIPTSEENFRKELFQFSVESNFKKVFFDFDIKKSVLKYGEKSSYENFSIFLRKKIKTFNTSLKIFSERWNDERITPFVLKVERDSKVLNFGLSFYNKPSLKLMPFFAYKFKIKKIDFNLNFSPDVCFFNFEKNFIFKKNFIFSKYPGFCERYPLKINIHFKDFVIFTEYKYFRNYVYPFERENDFSIYRIEPEFSQLLLGTGFSKILEKNLKFNFDFLKYFNSIELPFLHSYEGKLSLDRKIENFNFSLFLNLKSKTKSDFSYYIPSQENLGFSLSYNKNFFRIVFRVENLLNKKIYYQRFYGFDKILLTLNVELRV